MASDNNFTEYYVSGGIAGFGLSYAFGDEFGDNVEVGYGFDIEGISIGAAYGDYPPPFDCTHRRFTLHPPTSPN